MDRLVEHCLRFMSVHVGEIIKMPIDLSCVSDKLVHRSVADAARRPHARRGG